MHPREEPLSRQCALLKREGARSQRRYVIITTSRRCCSKCLKNARRRHHTHNNQNRISLWMTYSAQRCVLCVGKGVQTHMHKARRRIVVNSTQPP